MIYEGIQMGLKKAKKKKRVEPIKPIQVSVTFLFLSDMFNNVETAFDDARYSLFTTFDVK